MEKPISAQLTNFKGRRFLLVEDDELNLEIARELLELTHAIVDTATNGQEAVDAFINSEDGYYDAILMDIQMPVMDGYEATRQIRKSSHPRAKSIPVIAMTASAFSEDVEAAFQAGMTAHVAKPIDLEVLLKLIGTAMETDRNR